MREGTRTMTNRTGRAATISRLRCAPRSEGIGSLEVTFLLAQDNGHEYRRVLKSKQAMLDAA